MARAIIVRSFGPAATVILSALLLFSVVLAAEGPGIYPGKLRITKAKNLSPEQREVEARFAAYLEASTDEAVARYVERYGKEINTDNVRELSSDYAPGGMDAEDPVTVAARTRWGDAVHEPASALTREIFRRALTKGSAPSHPAWSYLLIRFRQKPYFGVLAGRAPIKNRGDNGRVFRQGRCEKATA